VLAPFRYTVNGPGPLGWSGPLPMGMPIPVEVAKLAGDRKLIEYLVRQVRRLHEHKLEQPDERPIPTVPSASSVAAIGATQVGDTGQATAPDFTAIRCVYNSGSIWGEGAEHHARCDGPDVVMEFDHTRQKEAGYVRGLDPGTLMLLADSSKAPDPARRSRVAALALYHRLERDEEGTDLLVAEPLLTLGVRLSGRADQRPRLFGTSEGLFTGGFSAQPLLSPATASDMLGLLQVFDWDPAMPGWSPEDRADYLRGWAKGVDQDGIAARWTQLARPNLPSGTAGRLLLGGAPYLTGRAGELIVAGLLQRLIPGCVVNDVASRRGLGYDLGVRAPTDERHVEAKCTSQLVAPATFVRKPNLFRPSQRKAAAESLQPGGTPWVAAVVTDLLGVPTVTFFGPLDVFPELALQLPPSMRDVA
jgi:hypothetical protein